MSSAVPAETHRRTVMPKAPTYLAKQTSKKVAVSRDWETAGWKRLISSPAHTQTYR
jgi:hypothetical protein